MSTARILKFPSRSVPGCSVPGGDAKTIERAPESPFRHFMHQHALTPREILHRRRMLEALRVSPPRSPRYL